MPIHVFVAYVDLYIGEQLREQFEARPHLFRLHGCTWDEAAVRRLSASCNGSPTRIVDVARDEDVEGGDSVHHHLHAASQATAPPEQALTSVSSNLGAATQEYSSTTMISRTTTQQAPPPAGQAVYDGTHHQPARHAQFFWRGDTPAVRDALRVCDWIIIVQRQAQDVLDMLHYIQQCPFEKPKRFALLSSFMTWYATPPLIAPHADGAGDGGHQPSLLDDDRTTDKEDEGEEDEAALRQMYAASLQARLDVNRATNAAAAADRAGHGREVNEIADNDDDAIGGVLDDEVKNNDGNADPTGINAEAGDEETEVGGGSGKEVLTEDQYNRRVPHARYYNWRDAEKAVAVAHHAHGLPLDTFVIFAGLAYGDGEDALQPFFRQAWSAVGAHQSLPIYGDGRQHIPMIHVTDLATFMRKLLRCPLLELPNPNARYLFATDAAVLSWRRIVTTINSAFGATKRYEVIEADSFPLHNNVELFTVDLRVEGETIAAVMDHDDGPDLVEDAAARATAASADDGADRGGAWVAKEGLSVNIDKVAREFCVRHKVTPLRLAVLGPPLVGKTFLCGKLAAHYRLPTFTLSDVVEAYKAELQLMRKRMQRYKLALERDEVGWQLWCRRRRLWRAQQRAQRRAPTDDKPDSLTSTAATEAQHGEVGAADRVAGGAAPWPPQQQLLRKGVRGGFEKEDIGNGGDTADDDDVGGDEPTEAEFRLTEDEIRVARTRAEERFESSAKVERWREAIAQMERVLLMRVRPRAATPDANPKRRAAPVKKKLTREQQRKKDEEDLQSAKEAIKDAPFQDRALALMMRWRLTRPDCLNQGYVLDGDPQTVELARLCFASDGPPVPLTDEEALQNVGGAGGGGNVPDTVADEGDDDDGAAAGAKMPVEHMHEKLLPDHVIVLKADENFLLDRLTTMQRRGPECPRSRSRDGRVSPEQSGDGQEGIVGGKVTRIDTSGADCDASLMVDRFHQHMSTFQQQFIERAYTLFDFFECASTDRTAVTPGGRRVAMHVIDVEGMECMRSYAADVVEESATSIELTVQAQIGEGHNFGDTPLDHHMRQVRTALIAEQERTAKQAAEDEVRARDAAAFRAEAAQRAAPTGALREAKAADLRELEQRKAPMYDELQKHVIPMLSKGLVEVCARRPPDPTAYLAEWLLRFNPHNNHVIEL